MDQKQNNHQQHNEFITLSDETDTEETNGRMLIVTRSAHLVKNLPVPAAVEQPVLTRRARVNRIIMRKRIHERQQRSLAPHVAMTTVIIFIVLFSLLSTGVGAAYAYYQAQLPLLNGVADHSLFQSTHIYDRNGHLLYELYDHQDGHGRRTYVNYSDISPLLIQATVAAEDHSFWQNNGVDLQGSIRAAIDNLKNQP